MTIIILEATETVIEFNSP